MEQGEIAFTIVGRHRRVRARDVMEYKEKRNAQRHRGLGEFTAFLQEEGFYSDNVGD